MIRVLVFATVDPDNGPAFETAFRTVRDQVRGTPGHLGDELLHDPERPGTYVLMGRWQSREAFLAWEDDPIHRQTTTPMRPYWVSVRRVIYDVAVGGDD